MAYFDTKKGSLEEAIKGAITRIEKLDPVNKTAVKKKFDDRKDKDIDNDGDVDDTDKYLHKRRKAISKAISKEEVELDEKNMKIGSIDFDLFDSMKGSKAANMAMNKEIGRASQMKDYKTARAYMDKVQKKYSKFGAEDSEPERMIDAVLKKSFKEDLDMDNEKTVKEWFVDRRKGVSKEVTHTTKDIQDSYEFGSPEATRNSLNMTPGQSVDDWDKQVDVMQKKQMTMRETLAKMWEVDEGRNPFKKQEEMKPKKDEKTMTGKPMTKVSVGMKEK